MKKREIAKKIQRQVPKQKHLRNGVFSASFMLGIAITVAFAIQLQSHVQQVQAHSHPPLVCAQKLSTTDQSHIDTVVNSFMSKNLLPAVSVAITKDGRLVYAKAYGVADKKTGAVVTTSSRFRIASVSKPITSTGILKLVEAGKISLDQKVFGQGSILGTTYTTRPRDSRINNITVRQLLTHTSGMFENDGNDPMFQYMTYSQSQLITKTLETRTLPSAPGSKYIYSNFGYMLLGRVIEKVTGQSYQTWMKANVMAPAGITSMQIGGSTLANRASNEVVYYPQSGNNPYGMNVERMDSNGGWITTATDLTRFMVRMDGSATTPTDLLTSGSMQQVLTPTSQSFTAIGSTVVGYGMGWLIRQDQGAWWHGGSMPGTESIVVRRPEGFTWAVLTNSTGTTTGVDIDQVMYSATSGVTSWPNCDLFFQPQIN